MIRRRMEVATRLPTHELNMFLITLEQAVDLARCGDIADGYEALLTGLHRARELAAGGIEWGAALVARYEDTMARFLEEWPVGRA